MDKYAQAALMAAKNIIIDKNISPIAAWEDATMKLFGPGSSQKKSCPKCAFLGLCEEGLINGIPTGNYTRGEKNKTYAVRVVKYIKEQNQKNFDKNELWRYATNGSGIKHNSQMDIVLELRKEDLL